jgi:hypothetical protein
MVVLRLVRSVGLGMLGVGAIGVPRADAGSFVGTYKFDGGSLAATVDQSETTNLLEFGEFGHQGTKPAESAAGSSNQTSDRGYGAERWKANTLENLLSYFEFRVTPKANVAISLTQLLFDQRRSSTGPTQWSLRSSLDGFGSNIGEVLPTSESGEWAFKTTRSFNSAFSDIRNSITFRFYGYGATNDGGTWRFDNVQLVGTANAVNQFQSSNAGAAAIPTPAILPALVSFGWGLWRRRQMRCS